METSRRKCCSSSLAIGGFVGCLLLAGLVMNATSSRSQRNIQADLELTGPKADAIYQLLAADDVPVLVGRRSSGRVYVQGTTDEVRTLQRFADLVARYEHISAQRRQEAISRTRQHSDRTESYRIPRRHRDDLYNLLAAPDVPVLAWHVRAAIRIQASAQDQDVIRNVVEILCCREP